MLQTALVWVALTVGALVAGGSFVGMLTSRSGSEHLYIMLAFVGFGTSFWAFVTILTTYDRLDAAAYSSLFGVAGFVGGYALASALLEGLTTRQRRPRVPDTLPEGLAKKAVVVLGEVEPPTYSARIIADALRELTTRGTLKASVALLPFIFMAQKMRYRAAGGSSPSARQLDSITERLSAALRPRNSEIGHVESAWCRGENTLAAVILKVVAQGFRTVAVAETFIADSLQTDAAKREVDALHLESLGVNIVYTQPLWRAERVVRLVVARVMGMAKDVSTTGIALVGRAQPDSAARDCSEFDAQETAFLQNVRAQLMDCGMPEANVRIAWIDWRSPDITTSLRHLEALGCQRIIVSPACFPLDSLETVLDIPLTESRMRFSEGTSVITLPAWHDDPGLIEALRSEVANVLDLTRTAENTGTSTNS